MFLITTLPVAIGVTTRHFSRAAADRVEPILSKLATGLFALIVVAAVAGNWAFFVENLTSLGPVLISLNAGLMIIGLMLAGMANAQNHLC